MVELLVNGGIVVMSILSLELIWLLVSIRFAPRCVKYIGLLAMVTGVISLLLGVSHAAEVVAVAGDVSMSLVAGGLSAALIPVIYGMIIYAISLLVRMVRKTKK